MPDVAVHAAFGREVLASLAPEIRDAIRPQPWTFGLFGPDLWFMHQPWRRREGRGRQMHTTRPGAFLTALLRHAGNAACREELFSWLAGFLCHYSLDSTAHPYIIHITANRHRFPRSHMSLEHALDIRQMERDGVWGERHPVTSHYFPRVSLPAVMRAEVDGVFREVYGWKGCWRAMNRSAGRYWRCYRLLENPAGFPARLARATKHPLLRSLAYSESQFLDLDPENSARTAWNHSHDPSLSSDESFSALREQARLRAVDMITASYRYLWLHQGTEEEIAALIGNASYLSGLPADDARNRAVRSLLPSGTGKTER